MFIKGEEMVKIKLKDFSKPEKREERRDLELEMVEEKHDNYCKCGVICDRKALGKVVDLV